MSRGFLALLPPSETKRDGGSAIFAIDSLAWDEQSEVRARTVSELMQLATDPAEHQRILKLSAQKSSDEIVRNAELSKAPAMPAVERYTGVLYDALDAETLSTTAREWLDAHVAIQSALLGLIRASDEIPAYRLSASTRLANEAMQRRWTQVCADVLARHDGPILDLRSKAYVPLGPLPDRENAVYAEITTRDEDGTIRSLNHFNKRAKGLIVRAFAQNTDAHGRLDEIGGVEDLATVFAAIGGLDAEPLDERTLQVIIREQ